MPRKDHEDKRVSEKQKRLSKKDWKALRKSRKETQKALDSHSLGWQTRDGKEF